MSVYLCIDLKSFYASVECVERGLDPFKTNLVVADPSRGKGAICLAITPYMKEQGIHNRCRLFEIPNHVSYITALPRMKLYIKYSAKIYGIYLKYVAREDILVYSIDECFLDVTNYLSLYKMDAESLAKKIIDDVIDTTGICATCGIGTNLFLTKVALDITAKHVPSHIGYLDEDKFKKEIWEYMPITDIWNIGPGTARRLEKYHAYTLHDVTLLDEHLLYKEFGVNAEYLIDHAYGREPVTIDEIHHYQTKNKSLSQGQILFKDYNYNDALLVMKEMVDNLVLSLVDENLITDNISLMIGYSKDIIPPTGGSVKLGHFTSSYRELISEFEALYRRTTQEGFMIRRVNICFGHVIKRTFEEISLFDVYDNCDKNEKELAIQHTIIDLKRKFGKNAVVKGMDLSENATTIIRNKLIGGHNAE